MSQDNELYVVTEQGAFAGLNIDDPSKKKVKKQQPSEDLIMETVRENMANLTK